MRIQGWHIVIMIVIVVILFGAPRLPGLARSVGQSLRIFKSEVKQMKDENNTDEPGAGTAEGRVVGDAAPGSATPTSFVSNPSGPTSSGPASSGPVRQDPAPASDPEPPYRPADAAGPPRQSGSASPSR